MKIREIPFFCFGGLAILMLLCAMTILHPIDTARAIKAAVWE